MSGPITILLVDDDVDYRTLAHEAILHVCPAARVWEVGGGCEAMDFLRRHGQHQAAPRPDMVYTDLEMPDMSGQELLKAISSHPDLRHVPVVMLTGVQNAGQRALAVDNGARGYLAKSTDHGELCRAMARTIRELLGPVSKPGRWKRYMKQTASNMKQYP